MEHSDAVLLTKIAFTLGSSAGFILNLKGFLTFVCLLATAVFSFQFTRTMVKELSFKILEKRSQMNEVQRSFCEFCPRFYGLPAYA